MSTTTTNLGLVKPVLADEKHQTIADLATNFQKLDDVSEVYVTAIPTSGFWNENKRLWYSDVNVGGHVGVVNIRSGQAAAKWQSIHTYSVGNQIVPTVDNGHFYTCTQPGSSGPIEPDLLVGLSSLTEDTKGKAVWQPSTFYNLYDVAVPSADNGRFYVCTVSGQSGTNEPAWSLTDGVATSDNGAVWMAYRIVKWQESGTAANFRPFGKIE